MPSKGVQCYCYVSVPDCEVQFSVPGKDIVVNQGNGFFRELLEVDKDQIDGPFNFDGRFSFKVTRAGNELANQWIDINCLTGNTGDGTMNALQNTPSVVHPEVIVSYGFYDAGHGEGGLTSEDQCYVTVTPNYSEWMKALVPPGSEATQKPFSRFVLPAVHDVGMNTMQNATALLATSGDTLLHLVLQHANIDAQLHFGLADTAISHIAPNIIESLAITEKDELQTMLAIGARYFEFRPARMHQDILAGCPLPDVLYFQHACIPGMAFEEFLGGLRDFLTSHPFEIAVVQVRGDGILAGCAQPSREEVDAVVEKALEGSGIVRGRVMDLGATVRELRTSGKRLIVMMAVDSFSTYTDEGNATLDGDSIVAEFEAMDGARQAGVAFTNIQCQATATNIRDAVVTSALSANASNSCLMSTKAICDSKTLPWVREHALEKLQAEQLIVIMNDFIDGATADVAVELSRKRLAA